MGREIEVVWGFFWLLGWVFKNLYFLLPPGLCNFVLEELFGAGRMGRCYLGSASRQENKKYVMRNYDCGLLWFSVLLVSWSNVYKLLIIFHAES